jgi:hypothetical protein
MDPNIPVQSFVQPATQKRLPQWLTTVTLFSKLLAMSLFIILPFLGFYLGMQYQQKLTVTTPVVSEVQKTVIPTPTPTPGSIDILNWKTYTNVKYNFTFKYLPDLNPKETAESSYGDARRLRIDLVNNKTIAYSVEVLNAGSQNINDFMSNGFYQQVGSGPSHIKKDVINNQTVYRFFMEVPDTNGLSGTPNILFQNNSIAIVISASLKEGNPEEILNDKALNEIASTFRFTQ